MRIFYVAQSTPNENDLPDSKLWHANLFLPLVDLGHEVLPFAHPWLREGYNQDLRHVRDRELSDQQRPGFSRALVEEVKKAHRERPITLLFTYLSGAHVEADAVREIRSLGIVAVNWYCNASYQFHNVAGIASAFDYCLVPEKFRLEDYRRVGAQPIYCQEAANPSVYRPYDLPQEFDVTFVGQRYGNRPALIRGLLDAGVDARVWGPGWQAGSGPMSPLRRLAREMRLRLGKGAPEVSLPPDRCGPALSDDDLVRMYSRSRISLGFNTVAGGSGIRQVRLRDFEATMSGAFYLVEHFDELTEFFEPGKEIATFRGTDELIEKARHYLRHENEREHIRRAGLARARAEHTWQRRFETVFRQIGVG